MSAHSKPHVHQEPNYMAVFFILFVLTVAEVAVTQVPLPRMAIVLSLIVMALAKAALVAAYFMHLKFERRTLAFIAVTPLVICTFLVFMLMPDAIH